MAVDAALGLRFGVVNEKRTGLASLALVAGPVKYLEPAEAQAPSVRPMQGRRGSQTYQAWNDCISGAAWRPVPRHKRASSP